jgi:hypothetical protein
MLVGWGMDVTGTGSCLIAVFVICSVESWGSATRMLVN